MMKRAAKAVLISKMAKSLLGSLLGLVRHAPPPKMAGKVGVAAVVAKKTASLNNALGAISLAFGLSELAVPERVARLVGVRPTRQTVAFTRACGAREVAEGAAILVAPRAAYALWSRVAGDAMDLSALGRSLADSMNRRGRLAAATAAVAGLTALDVFAGVRANGAR